MAHEQTKRILVLDSDRETGLLIERSLRDAGFVVHLAAAVPGALNLIDDFPFDAAVVDRGSGTGTAIQVAESLRIRLIPFVFLTEGDDVPAGFGDVPVIGKPFSPERLVGVIRSIFGPPRH